MSDSVKERLIEYLKQAGISKSEFSRVIGVSNAYITSIRQSISQEKIQSIALNYPNLNIEWLLTGKGEMLRTAINDTASVPDGRRMDNAIPLIPMDAFAGYPPQQYSDLPVEDYYHVAEFSRADFLIRVKGDSMTPKLNGGDIVACKKVYERLFFQWHRIYVIYTNSQGVMIKRVEQSERDGCIRLVSDNPSYQPFDIPESDIADIALVMGAITLE